LTQTLLSDKEERDRAIKGINCSCCVDASAGTGKTYLLIERILSLLTSKKATLNDICAITFTEKAAGELKVKLRHKIEENGLRETLMDLENAQISTIHSFAASILRERPVEAGVDPDFEVLDEMDELIFFDEVWEDWLEKEMAKKLDPLRKALELGITLEKIKEMALEFSANEDILEKMNQRSDYSNPENFCIKFAESILSCKAIADNYCKNTADAGFIHINQLVSLSQNLLHLPNESKERFIFNKLNIKKNVGNKKNWEPQEKCAIFKDAMKSLSEDLEIERSNILAGAVFNITEWLKDFVRVYRKKRILEGCLTFQDLLLLARNLLLKNGEVRRYFKRKYKYILVDEFQDTDPLQVEIVFFLAERDEDTSPIWNHVKIEPGKLFIVGDPKQSIYRFRRADIEMYEKAKISISQNPSCMQCKILTSFRAVPPLIEWTNRVFSKLITKEESFQPEYIPLLEKKKRKNDKRIFKPEESGVFILKPSDDIFRLFEEKKLNADSGRELEAKYVAATIRYIVDSWGKDYKNFAVLFPVYSGMEKFEEALRSQQIPYSLEGGKEFYIRQEIKDLTSLLIAIDNPLDKMALFSALRSFFFGFSDEEIFLFFAKGGELDFLKEAKDPNFSHAFQLLRIFYLKRNIIPISRLIEEIFDKTKALEFNVLKPHGEQAVSNLLKVIELARKFEDRKGATFRSFIGWLKNLEVTAREAESPVTEEDDNSVRLLTIHKAKGLEFPAVILANLASSRRYSNPWILERSTGSLEMKMDELKTETPGYKKAIEEENKRLEAEEKRLLYVACTRAKECLIIPYFPWGDGYLSHLENWLSAEERVIKPVTKLNDPVPQPFRKTINLDKNSRSVREIIDERNLWKERLERVKVLAEKGISIKKASRKDRCLWVDRIEEGEEIPEIHTATRDEALKIGEAFHFLMEYILASEKPEAENFSLISSWVAARFGIPSRTNQLEEMARKCIDSDIIRRALNSKRFFREIPFSVKSDEHTLLDGAVDLLFEEEDGLVIVDYKTDEINKDEINKMAEYYKPQGKFYADVFKKMGFRVKQVVFLFTRHGEEIIML